MGLKNVKKIFKNRPEKLKKKNLSTKIWACNTPLKLLLIAEFFLTERIFGTELEQSPTVNWTERSLKILNVNFWTDLFLERKQACPYRSLCHRNLLDLFPVIFLDGSFTIPPPPLLYIFIRLFILL